MGRIMSMMIFTCSFLLSLGTSSGAGERCLD